MSKAVTVGTTALFVFVLFATPLSLRLSPEGNLLLSTDTASAEIGRPLTPGSVAGVHRRAERRAYRRGYYGYGAYNNPYRYGYGTYQPTSWAANSSYASATGYGYGAYSPAAFACGKQLQKQCGGVPVLANNMQECLKKSQGNLSPSCVGLAEYVVGSCFFERRIAALPSRRGGSKQYSRMPENRRACGFPAMPCGSRYGFRALGYVRAIRPPRCLRQALSILRTSEHLTAREKRSRCHDP